MTDVPMLTETVLLLTEARNILTYEYVAAGGDDEAKENPNLKQMQRLLDRIDKHLGLR